MTGCMSFEEFIYDEIGVKDVENVEKIIEGFDIDDWLRLGDKYGYECYLQYGRDD